MDEQIRNLFEREVPPQGVTMREIAQKLELKGKYASRLQKCLNRLVHEKRLMRQPGNRYGRGTPEQVLTGRLSMTRGGNGFVTGPGFPDGVFIRGEVLGAALPGDTVTIRLEKSTRREGESAGGSVLQIVERGRVEIVGTLRTGGRSLTVVPLDPSYPNSFDVPDAAGANDGDRVLIRIEDIKDTRATPRAEIIEIIGPEDNASTDTVSAIRAYGLRARFPDDVTAEAASVSHRMDDPGQRTDLRNTYIITIDPVRARDFDDALSLERGPDGLRVLGVHIADVSHFVTPGSALDREAIERATSVYFPDKVLPMLPEQLSNGVCSLKPDVDRLAFSAFITYGPAGNIKQTCFAKTIIKSRLRLTYEKAMEVLADGGRNPVPGMPSQAMDLIKSLNKLAQQLRAARFSNSALDIDLPEVEIQVDEKERMTGVRVAAQDISHQLVEECMVAANEAVAAELARAAWPLMSRFHGPPFDNDIEELQEQLHGWGYSPGNLKNPQVLSAFLKSLRDDPASYHVRLAVLKSMKRAIYSASEHGHFGLAKEHYCHFTSPIRRYPDLVVHRQLARLLETHAAGTRGLGRGAYNTAELERMSIHCSQMERVAADAERTVTEMKVYRFLSEQIAAGKPQVWNGVVISVMGFGLFVDIPDLQVQGLIPIGSLANEYVRHEPKQQQLRAGKQLYRMGQAIRVMVVGVNMDRRRIDLELADRPAGSGKQKTEAKHGGRSRLRRRRG